jgi:hypothetical protein
VLHLKSSSGSYDERPGKELPFPGVPKDSLAAQVFSRHDGQRPMRETLTELGVPLTFQNVNRLRILLTTIAFPFLRRVGATA